MGRICKPDSGYLFSGYIAEDISLIETAHDIFSERMGCALLKESPVWDFSSRTSYYQREMGNNLIRKFYIYDMQSQVNILPKAKILSNEIEDALSNGPSRLVNIDPGWLSPAKLALASTKNYSHRIHLENGIYAEITMLFKANNWEVLPWTYPDYAEDYRDWFKDMRREIFGYGGR